MLSDAQTVGAEALASYKDILAFLTAGGRGAAELPLLRGVPGIEGLFRSMSAVAPATPGEADEEWNPLSQRPHAPLPPQVGDELGAAVTALKEAVDAFTTLAHEMMHVALWEPFFVGAWRPKSRAAFREFSLMAEGFCFFYSDIVIAGAVRVRLPDGEFALDRQTPSNARFPPVRAFRALGIEDAKEVLGIYLEGFKGGRTKLWTARGTSNFAAALAARAYDFYAGSLRLLDEFHHAVTAFGGFKEFPRRFCGNGLPSLLPEGLLRLAGSKEYFTEFFRTGLEHMGTVPREQLAAVRWRRMVQMRAYYALQLRWLLREKLVIGRKLPAGLADGVDAYLDELEALLRAAPSVSAVEACDARFDKSVRRKLGGAWAGHRWLIAPRRAGGHVSAVSGTKAEALEAAVFVVDELSHLLAEAASPKARAAILAQIAKVSALEKSPAKLRAELAKPHLRELWSVPLAAFDPVRNRFRELAFSYQ